MLNCSRITLHRIRKLDESLAIEKAERLSEYLRSCIYKETGRKIYLSIGLGEKIIHNYYEVLH